MDAASLVARVKVRFLDGEAVPADEVIQEMLRSVIDRVTIRMGTTAELPEAAGSIVVGAAMKCLRLRGYEGSTHESLEGGGSISNSFIDDVLAEYADDLAALKRSMSQAEGGRGIRFLRG